MAIREDLVASAVSFLQDPSVANSPLDRRVAFLQSKNLTQEEIDASLSRAGDATSAGYGFPQGQASQQQQQQLVTRSSAPPPPPQYGYGPPPSAWQQSAPPEIPRRDWRDYFIMATVTSGLGYGAYLVAKRYIAPLIQPPTPPQLEQDKAAVDEAFARAFELIEQVQKDTEAIKTSEADRKSRLDAALLDMETAVQELKQASRRRDDDTRRIADEVRSLQTALPRAIKAADDNTDSRMREINGELRSLKTLLANRVTGGRDLGESARVPRPDAVARAQAAAQKGEPAAVDAATSTTTPAASALSDAAGSTATAPERTGAVGRFGAKGGIPAWQLAAAKKSEEKAAAAASTESGTVAEETDAAA